MSGAPPRRVLVVEDESSQQLMYSRAIAQLGFEVVCVDHADAARAALAREAFAIVLLDLKLHGELSLDLFEEIRERHPAVSVVIATGHGTYELARRSIQKDVVDFLAKPIPLHDLAAAIDKAWSRHVLVQTPVARLLPPTPSGTTGDPRSDAFADERDAAIAAREDLRLENVERELIMEALRRSNDNRKVAADLLGISERTLYYRLTQYRAR
ncbi:MAG: response regulator [Phycisphaerae bacterium]|nr:response regulator [Phycisphaerae bacterium]